MHLHTHLRARAHTHTHREWEWKCVCVHTRACMCVFPNKARKVMWLVEIESDSISSGKCEWTSVISTWGIMALESMLCEPEPLQKFWIPHLDETASVFFFFFFKLLRGIFFYINSLETFLLCLLTLVLVTSLAQFPFVIPGLPGLTFLWGCTISVPFPLYSRTTKSQTSLSPEQQLPER